MAYTVGRGEAEWRKAMRVDEREILARKAQADRLLERAASELEILLKEACAELRPFPSFPDAFFTNAIECDPGPAGDPERGCIVVTERGELAELQLGVDHEAIELTGSWDPATARKESLEPVDLHPRDYVVYAYEGLRAVTEALLERLAEGDPAGEDE